MEVYVSDFGNTFKIVITDGTPKMPKMETVDGSAEQAKQWLRTKGGVSGKVTVLKPAAGQNPAYWRVGADKLYYLWTQNAWQGMGYSIETSDGPKLDYFGEPEEWTI